MIFNIFIIILLISLIISFIALKSFNILEDIQEYLLYIFFILLFWFFGSFYEDNFSIEQLIQEFELPNYGKLDYKLLISKNKGPHKCKISGKYQENTGLIYELDHTNKFCKEIIEGTNNLRPIADWGIDINLEAGEKKENESCETNKDCNSGLVCEERGEEYICQKIRKLI